MKLTKTQKYMRDYWRKNKEILREKKKLQIANNPKYAASLKRSKANWRKNNPHYTREYNKRRKSIDPCFKLRMGMRTRIYQALKGFNKSSSVLKLLGCSIEEFKIYIEKQFKKGMNWENHGEWELDHIFPLAKFNLTRKTHLAKAFHYKNYQPLWKIENRIKRDKEPKVKKK